MIEKECAESETITSGRERMGQGLTQQEREDRELQNHLTGTCQKRERERDIGTCKRAKERDREIVTCKRARERERSLNERWIDTEQNCWSRITPLIRTDQQ